MKHLEHIGIAVKNLLESNALFSALFAKPPYKMERIDSEQVITSFFKIGDLKIELLEASSEKSPIARFVEKRGEGIHHLAFEVEDINLEIDRLEKRGFRIIKPAPRDGADNKKVAFLHPKSANGILIELCQERRNEEKE